MLKSNPSRSAWIIILSSAAILMITMGARQSTGLFIAPIIETTGLGIVSVSLALAIGQFVWGLAQPIFSAVADKKGAREVLIVGALLLAAGLALTPFARSEWSIIVTLGLLSAAGAGAGSFSVLIGATARQLPPERRAFAGGFINAGSSFGQFVFAPLLQGIIGLFGWVAALLTMAATALLTIPLGAALCRGQAASSEAVPQGPSALLPQIRSAMGDRSYLCLHAGFFTCGFHVAFLVTHLPGEVALCGHAPSVAAASIGLIGLFNIAGSLAAGAMGTHYRMKYILAAMYGGRAVMIAIYLLAPKTPLTFYVFSACLGFTWLATVPPTAGLVTKLFGTRYLATLFGLTLLTHQIGAFFGAWLGGLAIAHDGNYQWMWYTDMVLASLAALVNLPIREDRPGIAKAASDAGRRPVSALWRTAVGWTAAAALVVAAGAGAYVYDHPAVVMEKDPGAFGGPFTLIDQTGRRVTDQSFRGRFMLVYFGYTYCPDVCPTSLWTIAEAIETLGDAAKDIQPILISVDPARDTPPQLADYASLFPFDLVALTGTADEIRDAAKAYQAHYSIGTADGETVIDHSARTYLLGPDGKSVDVFEFGVTSEELAARLRKAVEARRVATGG